MISHFVDRGGVEKIIMTVHPATAGNVNEQYVCVKLHVIITPNVSYLATILLVYTYQFLTAQSLAKW